MLVGSITLSCVVTDGVQASGLWILHTVMTDGCDAVSRAVRGCPDDIRPTEILNDILGCYGQDVCTFVDICKAVIPVYGIYVMSSGFKGLADGFEPGK